MHLNKGANLDSIYEYQFNTMRVSELRTKLDEKGLDVDGSREAMIATIQESFLPQKDSNRVRNGYRYR